MFDKYWQQAIMAQKVKGEEKMLFSSAMSRCVLLSLLVISVTGCHTIRPLQEPDQTILEQLGSKTPLHIGLVMDQVYRNFKSHDTGNPLADPQTYMIGEALAPLTEMYFHTAFERVTSYDELPSKNEMQGEDYFIDMQVTGFDNTMSIFPSEQTIDMMIRAQVYDENINKLDGIDARSSVNDKLGFRWKKKSGKIINRAIQDALSTLLAEIRNYLEKR